MATAKKKKPSDDFRGGYTPTQNSSSTGITSGWFSPPAHRDVSETVLDDIASWKRAHDLGLTPSVAETTELLDEVYVYVEVVREAEEDREAEEEDKAETEADDTKRRLSDENRKTLNEALAFAKSSWVGQRKQGIAVKRSAADIEVLTDKIDRVEMLIAILGQNSPIDHYVIEDSED